MPISANIHMKSTGSAIANDCRDFRSVCVQADTALYPHVSILFPPHVSMEQAEAVAAAINTAMKQPAPVDPETEVV